MSAPDLALDKFNCQSYNYLIMDGMQDLLKPVSPEEALKSLLSILPLAQRVGKLTRLSGVRSR